MLPEYLKKAEIKYNDNRKKEYESDNPCSSMMFQVPGDISYKSIYEDVMEEIAVNCNASDSKCSTAMATFAAHERIANDLNFEDFLPCGEPLLHSLHVDHVHAKTWQQPTGLFLFRAKEPALYGKMALEDIDLVNPTPGSDPVVSRVMEMIQGTQQSFMNSPLIPFSVQCVEIRKSDYKTLLKCKRTGKSGIAHYDSDAEDLVKVPVRFTIGDGLTWATSFRFGIEEQRSLDDKSYKRTFTFQSLSITEDIKHLWSSLPIMYAHESQNQIKVLKRFLSDVYDLDINFSVIDLETLAIATGCKMDEINHCTLSVVVNGFSMPVGIYDLDGGYAKPLCLSNPAYARCLWKELRHSYISYTVLMGLMIRNTFPDPDCVLSTCNVSQSAFVYWFCNFIGTALLEAKVGTESYRYKTRSEMILGLNPDSEIIKAVSELIICVPAAQFGGERHLHHARLNFFGQYEVLKDVMFPGHSRTHPVQSKDLDLFALLYKRTCSQKDFGKPVEKPGLCECQEDKDTLYRLNLLEGNMSCLHAQNGRELIPSLEEWGRLNPLHIVGLFEALRGLKHHQLNWWYDRLNAYETLRCILFRTLGASQNVPLLDREIHQRQQNVIQQENETLAKRVLQNQIGRTAQLSQLVTSESAVSRIGVHQKVYDNRPGDNHARNKKASEKRKARRARKMQEWSEHHTRKEMKRLKKAGGIVPGAPQSVIDSVVASGSGACNRPLLSRDLRQFVQPAQESSVVEAPASSKKAKLARTDLRHQLNKQKKGQDPVFKTAQAAREWKSLQRRHM